MAHFPQKQSNTLGLYEVAAPPLDSVLAIALTLAAGAKGRFCTVPLMLYLLKTCLKIIGCCGCVENLEKGFKYDLSQESETQLTI